MKRSKTLAAAVLLLGIFFLFQFGGEFFFALGKDKVPEKGLKNLTLSMKLFPLASDYSGEAGFSLLEKGLRDNDPTAVKGSMAYFLDAIKKNPLDYRSRYYLAKAYLQLSAVPGENFDMAVEELKHAAYIRGSNTQIALDCGKVFFSIWPLLEEKDQRFAAELLADAMPALSWEGFSPLLDMWSLYVQDAPLLMAMLSRRPDFFGPAANQLVASGIPLSWRWQLLDLYESYRLDANERLYNEKALNNEMDGEQALGMLNHLRTQGYFRLQPGSKFNKEKLARLQRLLLLETISGMLNDPKVQADPNSALKLRQHIQTYIADHSELNSLDELQKLLEEKNYFKSNDFASLHLKILIALKKGDYGGIINEIEALRKTISFVKKEQAADYTNILLLLVDSYYSSKLLTVAEGVARELYQNQPDNPDILYRVLRVQKILGDEGVPDKVLNEKLAAVENSRFLTVAKANSGFDVFLFNQPWIEIVFDPAWLAALKPKQLLQVFVDNRIAFESYVDNLPQKIAIGPPFTQPERKVRVQITVI
ncbi:MAG: hypothetical protein WCL37_07420 [Chrysiogenales bacterium]